MVFFYCYFVLWAFLFFYGFKNSWITQLYLLFKFVNLSFKDFVIILYGFFFIVVQLWGHFFILYT